MDLHLFSKCDGKKETGSEQVNKSVSLNSALNMGLILRGVHSEFPHKRVASS